MYEVFEHTADLGLRVRGPDLNALFADAGRGLFSMLVANPGRVLGVQQVEYRIEGGEPDYLLFDWLNELLYTFDTQRLLFSQFDADVGKSGLTAVCRGEPMDPARHEMDHEVKAITYHGLKVEQDENGWLAEVIVDI